MRLLPPQSKFSIDRFPLSGHDISPYIHAFDAAPHAKTCASECFFLDLDISKKSQNQMGKSEDMALVNNVILPL